MSLPEDLGTLTAMTRSGPTSTPERSAEFRYGKAYTVRQAAGFAVCPMSDVRRWLSVYDAPNSPKGLDIESHQGVDDRVSISFLQLFEIAVVAQFRRMQPPIPLGRLQRAHAFAGARFKVMYPFASLEMRRSGGNILHEFDKAHPRGPALALDIGGHWALPSLIISVMDRADFSEADQLAERWFPAGREAPLVLDPRMGAGRLTVLGTGVTVNTIHNRFLAGESIEFLASDYDLAESTIEEAIRYADRNNLTAA